MEQQNLFERIRGMKDDLGREVNEDILTDLIRTEGELSEHGFRFLRVSDGFAVFDVPKQNKKNWYREKGWPSAEKEKIVKEIARKYDLRIYEPPDAETVSGEFHHHFELCCDRDMINIDTIIFAHPRYLKVLIPPRPIIPERALLEDLSLLYKTV